MALVRNAVKCLLCQVEIESKHRHDFVWCKCGRTAVDGGLDYLKRCGDSGQMIELSEDEGGLITRHQEHSQDTES